MNESNRRITSLNRIDELNQRIAFQNDPLIASWAAKTVPRELKIPSRRLQSPPRPSKEGPRAPKSGIRSPNWRFWCRLGLRFFDSIHRFDSMMRFIDSLLRQHLIDSATPPAEWAKRLIKHTSCLLEGSSRSCDEGPTRLGSLLS